MNISNLFDVAGRTALVTGGSSGIGLMIAEALVSAGAKVYIASRKAAVCEQVAEQLSAQGPGQCIALTADLSAETGAQQLAGELATREATLDILVNNAGKTWGAPFAEFPEQAWTDVMQVNVQAVFALTKYLLPQLAAAGTAQWPARVVNIGSVNGFRTEVAQAYSYGASKAAVHHVTKMLAKELAPQYVNVNAIAPGPFPSKMMAFAMADEQKIKAVVGDIPRERMGNAEDMAGAILFLCSRASSYVTGSILPLDGGILIQS